VAAQRSFPGSCGVAVRYDDAQALIIEPHTDTVLAAPYNAAWKSQPVFRNDQREFIGNAEKVGKLQRRAGAGYVANNAWILVAAIIHLGGFHNFDPWRNPSFNHRNIPI
jgi:hypothetical protein